MLLLAFTGTVYAQDKVLGVIGSSTAAGTGASVIDSSWVGRLDYHYRVTRNVIRRTENLAVPSTTPYHGMPDGYVPPAGRPAPSEDANITELMTLSPDVILISYASNGYNTYSFEEIKMTLETIRNVGLDAGKRVYVTSSQPRTSFSAAARAKLRDVKDSIMKWFGDYAINFFDSIVDPSDLSIAAQYRYSGDDIHLNNAGHAVLYRQVLAKDIFAIALSTRIENLKASAAPGQKVFLQWTGSDSEAGTKFGIERSTDGRVFRNVITLEAEAGSGRKQYRYEDQVTNTGRVYYRLKIESPGSVKYSSIVSVYATVTGIPVVLKGNPVRGTLLFDLFAEEQQTATLSIYNISGMLVDQRQLAVVQGRNQVSIPFDRFTSGNYQLQVQLKERVVKMPFINAAR